MTSWDDNGLEVSGRNDIVRSDARDRCPCIMMVTNRLEVEGNYTDHKMSMNISILGYTI